ncbi:hypothetical protein ACTD5D_39795 [Nocardia takedensis]|uniref:hypothetical protein n=1 Tax=Nocardia takedensis TaxID=259390 RepID=UPI003F77784B
MSTPGPGPLLSAEQLENLGTDADALRRARLDEVIGNIRDLCGWHIAPSRTDTLILDGPGTRELLLPSTHVTAVASVVEDGATLAADQYEWSEVGTLRRRAGVWTERCRAVVVTLTHGYDQAPPGILGVILDVVADAGAPPAEKMGPFEFAGGGTAFKAHQLAVLHRYKATRGPS